MAIPQQASLFGEQERHIGGLTYVPDFITAEQESELLQLIDKQPWLSNLKRRVQHYGWRYDYTARRVDHSMRLGELPEWLDLYCQKLTKAGHFKQAPDQVIINEYHPGQGIALHSDCVPCFGDTIASVSLGSACAMDFVGPDGEKTPKLLEPRSLLIFSGDARYRWKHGIAGRKSDKWDGQTIHRGRRLSLTFRNVIVDR